jgi:hypothetical protein
MFTAADSPFVMEDTTPLGGNSIWRRHPHNEVDVEEAVYKLFFHTNNKLGSFGPGPSVAFFDENCKEYESYLSGFLQ